MKKMLLGTRWTPLGYHPEAERDLTPNWFHLAYSIGFSVVIFLFAIGVDFLGNRSDSGWLMLFIGTGPLAHIIFNWKKQSDMFRYVDAFFAIVFLGWGAFYLFRP